LKKDRTGEKNINNQGCPMKIVEYNNNNNIVVEFQDEYKARVDTQYCNFNKGSVKNPYYPVVYDVGIVGNKYKTVDENSKSIKEYTIWYHILQRCFDETYIRKHPAYRGVDVCKEWLYFPNFYEWLHNQSNFNKWYNGKRWAVDKDILNKGNKTYSPENCCIIPQNVNCLFLKREAERGIYPIGVYCTEDGFGARCRNPFLDKTVDLGHYSTPENAFYFGYKPYKEDIIKQVAQTEYKAGNITEECYQAMMNYEVEIDD
jgi:hypothetical protein